MEEDAKDSQRTHVSYQEQVYAQETAAYGAPVSKLVLHYLAGHNPSQKEAGEETANGKEYLSRNKIEHIEKILAANAQPI